MTQKIHETAIIHPEATIHKNVVIGPYCTVGKDVVLEDGVILKSHIVVDGNTHIGEHSVIFPFASIGLPPQDLKFRGEDSKLVIGARTTIREHVTINPGTAGGGLITQIGNDCLLMVGAHVAHDCFVGNNVIMANNATLAGHVHIGDFVIIAGLSAVHQFVRIGHHAMIGGMSGIENDVIPFGQASGERATLVGLNLVGLKRRKFNRDDIHSLRNAYRMLFSNEGTFQERMQDVSDMFGKHTAVMEIINFMNSNNNRAICQPKNFQNKSSFDNDEN